MCESAQDYMHTWHDKWLRGSLGCRSGHSPHPLHPSTMHKWTLDSNLGIWYSVALQPGTHPGSFCAHMYVTPKPLFTSLWAVVGALVCATGSACLAVGLACRIDLSCGTLRHSEVLFWSNFEVSYGSCNQGVFICWCNHVLLGGGRFCWFWLFSSACNICIPWWCTAFVPCAVSTSEHTSLGLQHA